MPEVAAIVLGAGSARRFGGDKLAHVLKIDGTARPVAAHSLLPWLQHFERVTVVVRPDAASLRTAVTQALGRPMSSRLDWLPCPEAASGMGASLACGVRAHCDKPGWMIGLADMPRLPAAAIDGVRKALEQGSPLAAAFREGRRGHPVGLSRHYLDGLLALKGDEGARHLLARDAARVTPIACDDEGIFEDIDTLNDLNRYQNRGN